MTKQEYCRILDYDHVRTLKYSQGCNCSCLGITWNTIFYVKWLI